MKSKKYMVAAATGLALLVGGGAGAAFGTSPAPSGYATGLPAGGSESVSCAGPSLTYTSNDAASGTLNCATPAPAPTTSSSPTPAPTTSSPAPAPTTSSPAPSASPVTKVLTVMEENHSLSEMNSGMPYLYSLAKQYGEATNYHAITHPSLPNYLAIAGGSTFGVTDDSAPSVHPISGQSVFGQAIAAGKTAKTYAESMTSNCELTSSGNYAVKHNPWAYFTAERTDCGKYDVPLTELSADIAAGSLPDIGMLIPNLADDAHNGTLATADNWLKTWLPKVMAGPDFTSGRLAIVVTGDEDDGSTSNGVLTVVIRHGMPATKVTAGLNHYSLTGLYDEALGAPLLRNAQTGMGAAFGLTTTQSPAPAPTTPAPTTSSPTPTPTTTVAAKKPRVFAYYYLWWSTAHWHSVLGPNYPYAANPLPLPATLDASGCSPHASYAGATVTDVPAQLWTQDDPAQIESDVREAASAGLTGFDVNWIGSGTAGETLSSSQYSQRLQYMVDAVHKVNAEGIPFKLWLSYKASAVVLPLSYIENDLAYFTQKYGNDPAFDHAESPKITVIWNGSRKYPTADLQAIYNKFHSQLRIIGDETTWSTARAPYLDGDAYYWSSQDPYTNPGSFNTIKTLAANVRATGDLWVSPVIAGYDKQLAGGSMCIPRKGGATLRTVWDGNAQSNPDDWAMISWNEIVEGTYIDPLQRYGTEEVDVLKSLIDGN